MDFEHIPHAAPVPSATRDEALSNPGFGTVFTDHMVEIDYDADRADSVGGGWHSARVCPRGPIELDPAAAVLHYAQEIFEGLKAYKHEDGSVALLRPAVQPAKAPSRTPTASRVAARSGSRRSFEAVPWALCLAVALTALRARVLLIDDMAPAYPFGLGAIAGTDPPWNG